jgi:hypothetical protein
MFHPEYKQRFIDHVQKHFFNGGEMMSAASIARLTARANESDPAIIAEAARWGDSKTHPPLNKSDWQREINWLRNTYFPSRGNIVLNQLRNDGIYTTFSPPSFSQHGGEVPAGYLLSISAGTNTVYYTTDGVTDPRMIGGGVNPSAAVQAYTGPISITGLTTVKARVRTETGQWSGLVEATFTTMRLPGDYDGDMSVGESDYLVWRANFGASVPPGTSADGSGDGVVDTIDYVLWRKNVGAAVGLAANVSEPAAAESSFLDDSAGLAREQAEALRHFAATRSEANADPARPAGRTHRPAARGPIFDAARDLLLTADLGSGLGSAGQSSISADAASGLLIDAAGELETADHVFDEVFSTFGSDSRLADLFRELS